MNYKCYRNQIDCKTMMSIWWPQQFKVKIVWFCSFTLLLVGSHPHLWGFYIWWRANATNLNIPINFNPKRKPTSAVYVQSRKLSVCLLKNRRTATLHALAEFQTTLRNYFVVLDCCFKVNKPLNTFYFWNHNHTVLINKQRLKLHCNNNSNKSPSGNHEQRISSVCRNMTKSAVRILIIINSRSPWAMTLSLWCLLVHAAHIKLSHNHTQQQCAQSTGMGGARHPQIALISVLLPHYNYIDVHAINIRTILLTQPVADNLDLIAFSSSSFSLFTAGRI